MKLLGQALYRTALLLSVLPYAAEAQIFGLSAILDPEGSRLFPQSVVAPRHPGKPDPRWRHFSWRFIDETAGSSKFRLYFYEEEDWTARFVMPRIRNQIQELTTTFNFTPPERFSYILFTSLREFRQANVFFITEGVQGVTSTTEATMAIPYWGSAEGFDHVSTHEMVHQFQYQKANAIGPAQLDQGQAMPLWFIEGQAELYSRRGIDPETRAFIRDVLANPNPDRKYTVTTFLENGPFDYVHIYKLGQAKLHFLETEFGSGTALRIFESASTPRKDQAQMFKEVVAEQTKVTTEELEKRWRSYLDRNFGLGDTKPLDDEKLLKKLAPSIDFFRISPDGQILAEREVDELTGMVSIHILPLQAPEKKTEAIHDGTPETASLYFLQNPSIALTNEAVAYIAEAGLGPELEVRRIVRKEENSLELGPAHRIELHRSGLLQVSSLAFSPDGQRIALTALNKNGWSNLYVLEAPFRRTSAPRELLPEPYDWQSVSWTERGLIASSNRTASGKYAVFKIDDHKPDSAPGSLPRLIQLSQPTENHRTPEWTERGILVQSEESGVSQIHLLTDGKDIQLTHAPSGVRNPVFRNGKLYAVAMKGGRFHVYNTPFPQNLPTAGAPSEVPASPDRPWQISPAAFPPGAVRPYVPFKNSGTRVDGIIGYFASGGAFGLAGGVSDLFRDYSITGEISFLGSVKYSNAYAFFTSAARKTKWTTGAYAIVQPRLDNIFQADDFVRTYLHREYGALGALQYPLGIFSFADAELRVAGVKRTDIDDPAVAAAWEARNPGTELLLTPVFRLGYDSILYEMFTGPIRGFGIVAESETSYFPKRKTTAERVRLDLAYYVQVLGRTVLSFQGMTGSSWGRDYGNPFLLSSDDILRGYSFFDPRLYGNYFTAAKSEIRFPIGTFFGFPPLRGMFGYDIGTVYRTPGTAWSHVSSSRTWGITINIPPLSIGFLNSTPIRSAPGPASETVTHFLLRYLYL